MMRVVLTAVLAISLTGCGLLFKTKPLTSDSTETLNNSKVVVTKPFKVGLSSMTLTDVYLGIFSPDPDGYEIAEKYNIEDPIDEVQKKVLNSWKQDLRLNIVGTKELSGYTVSAEDLVHEVGSADYVLDISTANITFTYQIGSFTDYHVKYSAKIQLVDTETNEVVAQKLCNTTSGEDKSYTYDDYLSNDAKLLKAGIKEAANNCAYELSVNALKA